MTIGTGFVQQVETLYAEQSSAFAASPFFRDFEQGNLSRTGYREFIARLFVTHYQSPRVVAFCYSVAPPEGEEALKHNLLEELGMEEGEDSHPELLVRLLVAAGFSPLQIREQKAHSEAKLRALVTRPLLFGTLAEAGLSVVLEVSAFEWMLSRLSTRIGDALAKGLGLERNVLEWFYHHSEVDIRHAEEALEVIGSYCEYYSLSSEEAEDILDLTFRDNVFLRHYGGGGAVQSGAATK